MNHGAKLSLVLYQILLKTVLVKKITARGRIWLEIDGENFLGSGRAELMKTIDLQGTLRKSAVAMGLSYRKAYYAVRSMNNNAPVPLVTLRKGGSGGGKAELTEAGKTLIQAYQKLSDDFSEFLENRSAELRLLYFSGVIHKQE